MTQYIPVPLREAERQRAAGRCEYCRLSQAGQEAEFHIDHVVPNSAGGATSFENLAVACVSCSLRKAARQFSADPVTGQHVALFNPRLDSWAQHFHWDGVRLVGRSATGRATVDALGMNRQLLLSIRREESILGRHPP